MNKKRFASYLRTYRRHWGLTQVELAFLLGLNSDSGISRLERQKTKVTLRIAFACFVVFGEHPSELFPGLSDDVESGVMARVWDLYHRLQGDPSKTTRQKIKLLEAAIEREEKRRGHRQKV